MKHEYRFEYGRIVLEPLEESDIEQLRVLRNSQRQFFISQDEMKVRHKSNGMKDT